MTRSSVILHRHTYNIQQTGNERREGVGSLAHTVGLSPCSRDDGGCYLGNVSGQGPRLCGYGEPGPGSSDGKALWHPATPPHRPHARKARRSTGPHTDLPSGLQLAACPSRPRSPSRSLPSPAPVPPHSGCPWLGPGLRMGVLAQPVPALAMGTVSASPLMVVLLPCSKLVPGSLPFILLAQASAWEAYWGPQTSLSCSCHCSLRAGILPL